MTPLLRNALATSSFEEQRADRRFEPLQARSIRVLDDGGCHPFEIGNLSAHGLAGSCAHALRIGRYYRFAFESGEMRMGEIRWTARGKIGVYFRVALGPDLLSGRSAQPIVPRAPRFATRRPATIHHALTRRPAIVRNVSVAGLLLETVMTLHPGDRITVECGTLILGAEVRWSRQVHAGVRLDEAITLERFEQATHSVEAPRAAAV